MATENTDLKRIQQIKALTFEGLKSRDDVIIRLKAQLENAARDMQLSSNQSRLERQKQTNSAAKQLAHEKARQEHQAQLQQRQQQLLQQRQQIQQQQQMQAQRNGNSNNNNNKKKQNSELTYFDNLDDGNCGDETSSEPEYSDDISDENDGNSDDENSCEDDGNSDNDNDNINQPSKRNYHRRKAPTMQQRQRYAPYRRQAFTVLLR